MGSPGLGTPPGGTPRGPAEERCHCSRDFLQGSGFLGSHVGGSPGSWWEAAASVQWAMLRLNPRGRHSPMTPKDTPPPLATAQGHSRSPPFGCLRRDTHAHLHPAHMARASKADVVGVPPALPICHPPAARLQHTIWKGRDWGRRGHSPSCCIPESPQQGARPLAQNLGLLPCKRLTRVPSLASNMVPKHRQQ